MSKRQPSYAPTRAAVHAAWQVVVDLLDSGPQAVTLAAVAKGLDRSVYWAKAYLDGEAKLRVRVARQIVDRVRESIAAVDPTLLPPQRVAAIVDALIPQKHHRAYAWALVIVGWEIEAQLALQVANALEQDAGEFAPLLGAGVLGVVRSSILPGYQGSRDEMARRLAEMIRSVEHFAHILSDKGLA